MPRPAANRPPNHPEICRRGISILGGNHVAGQHATLAEDGDRALRHLSPAPLQVFMKIAERPDIQLRILAAGAYLEQTLDFGAVRRQAKIENDVDNMFDSVF